MTDIATLTDVLKGAIHRIITLEKEQVLLLETQEAMADVMDGMSQHMDRIRDELDILLNKPVTQMSGEDIRPNACGGVRYSLFDKTPLNPTEAILKRILKD